MNKLEEEKIFLEQNYFHKKKKKKYIESKEKIDHRNSFENKNLENLYNNLDSLTIKLSSNREKNSILKYDAEKFNEKINELNLTYKEINNELKSIKNKEDLFRRVKIQKEKVKKR